LDNSQRQIAGEAFGEVCKKAGVQSDVTFSDMKRRTAVETINAPGLRLNERGIGY
jgi:hypothetical protein